MCYLYHYTSLETLALILKSRTIRFNNLSAVDDLEEAQTEDMGYFGQCVYVSCWTENPEESIILWNMYTPKMTGVRIALPVNPFKKYLYKKGQFFFTEDVESYIDYQQLTDEDKIGITSDAPQLTEVEYTSDENKIFPRVKYETSHVSSDESRHSNTKTTTTTFDTSALGRYKRDIWQFQEEWRYKITAFPVGIKERLQPNLNVCETIINRVENLAKTYPNLYLHIADDAFQQLKITMGPSTTDAQKIILQALCDKYCPTVSLKESALCNKVRAKS